MKLEHDVLEILQKDSTLSNSDIAHMLEKTEEEVACAVERLKKDGVLLRYSVLVNTEAMGDDAPSEALIEVKVSPERDCGYNDIARRIYKFSEVKAVFLMSGRCDLLVKIEAKTMKAISQFVWEKLSVLEGVSGTETLFIMRKYKEFGEELVPDEKEMRLLISP